MLTSLIGIIIASNITLDQDVLMNSEHLFQAHTTQKLPEKNSLMISPIISAKSALVMDMDSGAVLFEKNSNEKLPFASITKLMTSYILLEENNIEETVRVSQRASSEQGSRVGLFAGEEISVENLIYGMLINSGNDAATALAEHNAGSVSAFVQKMNNKGTEIGLYNTHFQNPSGFDHSKHYSSALDIAKLSKLVYEKELIKDAVITKNKVITNTNGNRKHYLKNTNDLLDSYLNIKGLKTGTTPQAGQCLAIITELENGRKIISVVLGSTNRFRDSKIIVDWTERAYFLNNNL